MPVFDEIMNEAVKSRGIPGGALAIAKNGRLLVAQGYGLAIAQTQEPVTLDTLFCTATITKTITAVAVLHLVEQGKLSLDDSVYSLLGKPRALGGPTVDAQVQRITVRQLLLNAGGWDIKYHTDYLHQTQRIGKATGQKLPLSADTIVRYGLSQAVDYSPGTESHYSSFGYFLAKMVVERTARQPYETYVRQQVFRPMGIHEVRIEQLAPSYAARGHIAMGPVDANFPADASRSQPAGDWLSSIVDLARFLTAVSGSGGTPFLDANSRREMVAVPPMPLGTKRSGAHVGLGWDVVSEDLRGIQYHKSGTVAGVRTYIAHRSDGVDWVLLLNSEGQAQGAATAASEIIDKIDRAIDATRDWPDRNLFEVPAIVPAQRPKSAGSLVM